MTDEVWTLEWSASHKSLLEVPLRDNHQAAHDGEFGKDWLLVGVGSREKIDEVANSLRPLIDSRRTADIAIRDAKEGHEG